MAENEQLFDYEEDAAVAYIRCGLPSKMADKFQEDDILEVIDLIFDYYEQNGMLELSDFDSEEDAGAIASYVADHMRGRGFSGEELAEVVRLELEYEDSLNVF